MTGLKRVVMVPVVAVAVGVLVGAGAAVVAEKEGAKKVATTAELGGEERYLTCVATDKPIYRANEKVYARAIVLNAATRGALADDRHVMAQMEIRGPKGETVTRGSAPVQDSVAGFEWTVPAEAAGGEYTLRVSYPWMGYAPAERKFDVRVYRAPRLKSQVKFVRDGYGPGDSVTAMLHTERAEGGLPGGAKVTVTARVDEVEVYRGSAVVDGKGECAATFALPTEMARGEGTVAFAIEDGGTVETAAKTIPILLQTLDLAIYPESGDAVAGHTGRYYVEAKLPSKKPADVVGEVVDGQGKVVAAVRTEHEGRGRFEMTPLAGETYTLRLTQPAGMKKTWALPEAKAHGATLRSVADVVGRGEAVKMKLMAVEKGTYKVTLRQREKEVAEAVEVKVSGVQGNDTWPVEFKPAEEVAGVLTATAWGEDGTPLAERLVYREPSKEVVVKVVPEAETYTPGGKASVKIETTDLEGKPVSAMVGLTVTDDSVLEMVEKREQAPRLPAMVYLEPEVRELGDAGVYLDKGNAKSGAAVDLLLGTQGWRRFALVEREAFLGKYGDDGWRALAVMERPAPAAAPVTAAAGIGGAMPRGGAMQMAAEGQAGDAVVNRAVTVKQEREKLPEMPKEELADKRMMAKQMVAGEIRADAEVEDRFGGGGGFAGGQRMRRFQELRMMTVREYAHVLRPNWTPTERNDFTETVYWNAGIKTDAAGKATASFALADGVTTYRILADGFDGKGAVGMGVGTLKAVQPFYAEVKMPLEVTAGDEIGLPVTVVNGTKEALSPPGIKLELPAGVTIGDLDMTVGPIPAGGRMRYVYPLQVAGAKEGEVRVKATAGAFGDQVTRKLRVKPKGFPTQVARGGMLEKNGEVTQGVVIPGSVVPGSMETAVVVYSSPVANMTEAVAALLREPCGCFEQTSSSAYPLAMAQQYFTTHQGVDPKLIAQANEMLKHGYDRLISFECKEKGYEWFGQGAGHEALTAYGLMEFRDMKIAKLSGVDEAMIGRTRTWLLGRRDGKGGFERNARALDSFGGAPSLTTNAYIVWALLESGETGLETEVTAIETEAAGSKDSYVLALAAKIASLQQDRETARSFMTKLAAKQAKDGQVEGAETSITRSGGEALAIETTALAALAWMQEPAYAANVEKAIRFLAESCKAGRFGSTQSTVLALKAITTYDSLMAHPAAAGEVMLLVDGKATGESIAFTADTKEPLKFKNVAEWLTPGEHTLAIQMKGGSEMPYSVAINYSSVTPSSDPACKLRLQTELKDAQVQEGGITETTVTVSNVSDQDAATPVAIVGIPGGLEVRHDQLKELVKAGKIDAYEVSGREVVLYWRQVKAGAKVALPLSLTAAIPGTYTAPASRVYEYYTDEAKQWVEGEKVAVVAK